MKEMKRNETRKDYALIKVLGITVLVFLMLVGIAGASPFAYITNYYSNDISVIDTATNNVTATIPVGGFSWGIAINPAGTKVYVTQTCNSSVLVIDTTTNTVIAKIYVGSGPHGVAVTPDGKKVYVTNCLSGTVSVIDTAQNKAISTVKVGIQPMGIAVTPDGKKVYVADYGYTGNPGNTVFVIDTATNKVTANVTVGSYPFGVAVNPKGTKVYVTNYYSGNVSVIDTANNKVTTTVKVGSGPRGIAVTPDGKKVYVTNYYGESVSVIDTSNNKVTATMSDYGGPMGIAVTPDGKKVYVANFDDEFVSVFDTATDTHTAVVLVENNPCSFGQFICTPPALTKPVANFTSNVTSGYAPLDVLFKDTSTGSPTSWKLSFGDGTISTTKNLTHTYSKVGKYTVSLTVKNEAGSSTKTIKDYITVKTALVKPVAAFSASPTSGNAPLKVKFADKSTGSPTSWEWSFGDGKTSTSKNPAYTYTKAGKYTVNLTVKNAAGTSIKTIKNYINVKSPAQKPIAAFSASPRSGKAPLKVQFTDKSTGSPTSWKWSFGDGTYSTAKSPAYKYNKAGKYTVKLTVKNAAGSSTKTMTNYITVK